MSNPPRESGTGDNPINSPSGRPQPPAGGRPGRGPAPIPGTPDSTPPGGGTPPGQPGHAPQPTPGQARPGVAYDPITGAPVQPGQSATQRQPPPQRGIPGRGTGPQGRVPAAQQRQPIDVATRLDGQRGWLAQIDRSLKKRSIIALVLTCLAVGVGAAAIYISLTKNADGDRIDALQTRVEALEAAAGIPPTDTSGTDSTLPGTDSLIPETGTTLPDGATGVTDGSGLIVPPE